MHDILAPIHGIYAIITNFFGSAWLTDVVIGLVIGIALRRPVAYMIAEYRRIYWIETAISSRLYQIQSGMDEHKTDLRALCEIYGYTPKQWLRPCALGFILLLFFAGIPFVLGTDHSALIILAAVVSCGSYIQTKGINLPTIVNDYRLIYFIGCLILLTLIFFFCPVAYYYGDMYAFYSSLTSILHIMLGWFTVGSIGVILIWLITPSKYLGWLARIVLAVVALSFANVLWFQGIYGHMIDWVFSRWRNFYFEMEHIVYDFCAITLTIGVLVLSLIPKFRKYIIGVFYVVLFGLISQAAFCYYNMSVQKWRDINEVKNDFDAIFSVDYTEPSFHGRVWGLSKTHPNVIGLFLDAFTGSHLGAILSDDPKLVDRLDGFVYFDDCLSIGNNTFVSVPGIYGGPRFDILSLDKASSDITIEEKLTAAWSVIPNALENFDVVYAGTPYLWGKNPYIKKYLNRPDDALFLSAVEQGDLWNRHYVPYYISRLAKQDKDDLKVQIKMEENVEPWLITMLTLFRCAPLTVKNYIYNSGIWFNSLGYHARVLGFKNRFLPYASISQYMSDFAHLVSSDEDNKGRVKIIKARHKTFGINYGDVSRVAR